MKNILVTGGAGFVGSHIVRLLLERGDRVRVLARRPDQAQKALQGLSVEIVTGDLRNPESLRSAIAGCDEVYHCAADYRLWTRHPQELYESNVEGTRSLLGACRDAGVTKVIYTSSVAAIGIPPGGVGDEETPVTLEDMIGHYKRSKFLGQEVALKFAAEGYPVYIVNPSTPIGPGDSKPTATGKIILDFLRGKMPAYLDTGLNLVAVEDVARGHLLAAEKGVPGRLYILGDENLTLKQILDKLAAYTGLASPWVRLPYGFVFWLARLENFFTETLLRREPFIPLEGVKMAKKRMWFSADRARRELGFETGSATRALERAVMWFVDNGYCPGRRKR